MFFLMGIRGFMKILNFIAGFILCTSSLAVSAESTYEKSRFTGVEYTEGSLSTRGNIQGETERVGKVNDRGIEIRALGNGSVSVEVYIGHPDEPDSILIGSGLGLFPTETAGFDELNNIKLATALKANTSIEFSNAPSSCTQIGSQFGCVIRVGELADDGSGVNGQCNETLPNLYYIVSARGKMDHLQVRPGNVAPPEYAEVYLTGKGAANWVYSGELRWSVFFYNATDDNQC